MPLHLTSLEQKSLLKKYCSLRSCLHFSIVARAMERNVPNGRRVIYSAGAARRLSAGKHSDYETNGKRSNFLDCFSAEWGAWHCAYDFALLNAAAIGPGTHRVTAVINSVAGVEAGMTSS